MNATNETDFITERNVAEKLPETDTKLNNRLKRARINVEVATLIPGESDHKSKDRRGELTVRTRLRVNEIIACANVNVE